jgi:hypothetical protein
MEFAAGSHCGVPFTTTSTINLVLFSLLTDTPAGGSFPEVVRQPPRSTMLKSTSTATATDFDDGEQLQISFCPLIFNTAHNRMSWTNI